MNIFLSTELIIFWNCIYHFQVFIYFYVWFLFSVGTYLIQGRDVIFNVVNEALKAGYRAFGK